MGVFSIRALLRLSDCSSLDLISEVSDLLMLVSKSIAWAMDLSRPERCLRGIYRPGLIDFLSLVTPSERINLERKMLNTFKSTRNPLYARR